MADLFKNVKVWCAVGGAAAVIIGEKIIKSEKTRKLAVTGIAKCMKLGHDAKEAFQDMKDEAADICCDARIEAGLDDEIGFGSDDETEVNAE